MNHNGKKCGYLILVKKYHKEEKYRYGIIKRIYWECRCICGKVINRRQDYLFSDRGKNASCGCKHSMKSDTGSNSKTWKGYGKISGQYFSLIKNRANKKNLTFNITKKYIWNLYLEQGEKCALTSIIIDIKESRRSQEVNEMTASLDRIDSTKGYIKGNVQWVHKDINRMKNNYDQDYFIEMCHKVSKSNKQTTNEAVINAHTPLRFAGSK